MPSLPWPRERAQRKYVDLIKEAGAKWPNWEAPVIIHAGEIGTVDRKTGEWKSEGNIYTHPDIAPIARRYPLAREPVPEVYQIHSYETRGTDAPVEVGTPGVPGLVFKSQFQFNAKRGAIMVMHRALSAYVPRGFFDEVLKLRLPALKGKSVVYQVYTCPGFFMYLSDKASEQVTISLRVNVTPPAAGTNNLPSATYSWHPEGTTGIHQQAYRPNAFFTPLYCLRDVRRPLLRRDEMDPVAALDRESWEETDVPWDDLDDDGVTEPEDEFPGPDEDEEF
ncbi:hypothetical protein BJV78DRAFT_1248194 [Lactifluus subvellereus]|nr:hypothetical protein BJV78DRAFT_1248194 [Lactifluus subvellereus]